ncbi:MAG: hypothetical protein H6741_31070 [Alphaproteobacteria bacterium]|nr:hypothetical protein [Alphaproteobacteria bacterium]
MELLERFDPEQDALILAVSEKDAERLGGGRYLRPLPEVGAPLLPFGEAGHVVIAPLFHEGLDASGIRAHLRSTTEPRSERFSFLQALYQRDSEEAFDLLISRLSPQGLASASMTDKNCP